MSLCRAGEHWRGSRKAWLIGFLPIVPFPPARIAVILTRVCASALPLRVVGHNKTLVAPPDVGCRVHGGHCCVWARKVGGGACKAAVYLARVGRVTRSLSTVPVTLGAVAGAFGVAIA